MGSASPTGSRRATTRVFSPDGEVHLGGEDLGGEELRALLQHLRGGAGRPLGVAGLEEIPPGTLQPLEELRLRLAGSTPRRGSIT